MTRNHIDDQFIAELGGRKFAMLSDMTSLSGWRLFELTSDKECIVESSDPLYAQAYTAARKLMP